MKLQQVPIEWSGLQDYLDKYQDKIKFILYNTNPGNFPNTIILIIDMA